MIDLTDLHFSYEKTVILNHLSLRIHKGEFCAIVGPNGVGKSTLLKIIARLLTGYRCSHLLLDGRPINEFSPKELAKYLAYVPQSCHPAFDLTVRDSVAMGRNPYLNQWGTLTRADEQVVDEMISKTHLAHLQDRPLSQLSGGELQRTMIARAMAQQTPLLLLDEPLANLNIAHQYEILDILCELNRTQQTTILLIIHNCALAKQYASSTLLLASDHSFLFDHSDAILTADNIRKYFNLPDTIAVDEHCNTFRIS